MLCNGLINNFQGVALKLDENQGRVFDSLWLTDDQSGIRSAERLRKNAAGLRE